MKLLYYEWRKFVFRKYMLAFFLLLSLLDISKILLDYYQGGIDELVLETKEVKTGYGKIYQKVKGVITEDKVQFVEQEKNRLLQIRMKKMGSYIEGEETYSGNLYEDCRIFIEYIYEEFKRCAEYGMYSEKLEKGALDNVEFYRELHNSANRKVNEFIARTYSNRNIHEYYRTESTGKYFNYTFSSMLILIMCFLGVIPMFMSERDIQMWDIIGTTYIGRCQRKNIKILAALLYGVGITVWFRLLDFISFRMLFGMEGLDNPIWLVKEFQNSPLNCSIRDYILYDAGIKALAICVVVLSILVLSLSMNKVIHAAIGFAVLTGIWLFLANGMDSLDRMARACALCSPITLMNCSELFCEFVYIEIGSMFIRGELLAEVAAVILILLQVIILKFFMGKRLLQSRISSRWFCSDSREVKK